MNILMEQASGATADAAIFVRAKRFGLQRRCELQLKGTQFRVEDGQAFSNSARVWTPSQTFLRQTTEYVPLKVTDDGCVGGRRGSDIMIRSGELHVSFMSVLSFSRHCKGGLSAEPERVCGVREILARRVTRSTDYWRFD